MDQIAPFIWLVCIAGGALALGAAFVWGLVKNRRASRDPGLDQARDNATKDMYRHDAKN